MKLEEYIFNLFSKEIFDTLVKCLRQAFKNKWMLPTDIDPTEFSEIHISLEEDNDLFWVIIYIYLDENSPLAQYNISEPNDDKPDKDKPFVSFNYVLIGVKGVMEDLLNELELFYLFEMVDKDGRNKSIVKDWYKLSDRLYDLWENKPS